MYRVQHQFTKNGEWQQPCTPTRFTRCPRAYELQCKCAIVYAYHATYIMSVICTYAYSCILTHAQLEIYVTEHINSSLNHTIHANILSTHTLTSTSHRQSGNDLLYPLGLIVTPCPQIVYNQAMQWPQSYTNSYISLSLMDNYINMHIIAKQHTPISRY